jgi:hypothetical protein
LKKKHIIIQSSVLLLSKKHQKTTKKHPKNTQKTTKKHQKAPKNTKQHAGEKYAGLGLASILMGPEWERLAEGIEKHTHGGHKKEDVAGRLFCEPGLRGFYGRANNGGYHDTQAQKLKLKGVDSDHVLQFWTCPRNGKQNHGNAQNHVMIRPLQDEDIEALVKLIEGNEMKAVDPKKVLLNHKLREVVG